MLLVMPFEMTKSRITEAVKMKECVFASRDRLKLERASGASTSLRSRAFIASKRLDISYDDQVKFSASQLEAVIQIG